jgi:hypothetical protein
MTQGNTEAALTPVSSDVHCTLSLSVRIFPNSNVMIHGLYSRCCFFSYHDDSSYGNRVNRLPYFLRPSRPGHSRPAC